VTNDFQVSKHFNLQEFQCRHCGVVKLHPQLVHRLQQLRDDLQTPITVTSGYRCPEHNRAVGGASKSQHLEGLAADVKAAGYSPQEIADTAELYGFRGIGVYKTFTHLDMGERIARWEG
jgi:uncharacterized protein YcbK (DUF882 family)